MYKNYNKEDFDIDFDFYTELYPTILEQGINTPREIMNYYINIINYEFN